MTSKRRVCELCGEKYFSNSKWQRFCENCHNHHDKTQLKGGFSNLIKMSPKQKEYNQNVKKQMKKDKNSKQKMEEESTEEPKESKVKVNITAKREDDAKRLIEFMKTELGAEDKDLTKIISRAYRIIKGK